MKAKQKLNEMEAELQAASEEIKARKEEEGKVTTGKKYYMCIVNGYISYLMCVESRYSLLGEESLVHLGTHQGELAYNLNYLVTLVVTLLACIKL